MNAIAAAETVTELYAQLVNADKIDAVLRHAFYVLNMLNPAEYRVNKTANDEKIRTIVKKLKALNKKSKCNHRHFIIEYGDGIEKVNLDDIAVIKRMYGKKGTIDEYQRCHCCDKFISITRTVRL